MIINVFMCAPAAMVRKNNHSGLKYKKCCLNESEELQMQHVQAAFERETSANNEFTLIK
jgi:hypothetical protein